MWLVRLLFTRCYHLNTLTQRYTEAIAGNHRGGVKRDPNANAPRADRYKENNQVEVVAAGKPMPPRKLSQREQQVFDHLVSILEDKKTRRQEDDQ